MPCLSWYGSQHLGVQLLADQRVGRRVSPLASLARTLLSCLFTVCSVFFESCLPCLALKGLVLSCPPQEDLLMSICPLILLQSPPGRSFACMVDCPQSCSTLIRPKSAAACYDSCISAAFSLVPHDLSWICHWFKINTMVCNGLYTFWCRFVALFRHKRRPLCQIRKIVRPTDVPDSGLVCDLRLGVRWQLQSVKNMFIKHFMFLFPSHNCISKYAQGWQCS